MKTASTLVIGASLDETKYSNLCLRELVENDIPAYAIGLREGSIAGVPVVKGFPILNDIHTVTLYLNAIRQLEYYDYLLKMKPARVIFNPGTENPEFETLLEENGIEVVSACSIMMLKAGVFFENN
jgi:uncharacterized protein